MFYTLSSNMDFYLFMSYFLINMKFMNLVCIKLIYMTFNVELC